MKGIRGRAREGEWYRESDVLRLPVREVRAEAVGWRAACLRKSTSDAAARAAAARGVTVTLGKHWFSCLSVSSSSCFIACAVALGHTYGHAHTRRRRSINLRARLHVDAGDAGAERGVHWHVVAGGTQGGGGGQGEVRGGE